MILDKLKSWLTFNYDKSPESKVSKILSIISEEFEEIQTTFKTIEEWEDVDNAEGRALEDLGQNILQFRGQAQDGIYRVLIRSKVARNRATTTYNNMLEIISLMLGVPYSDIQIEVGTHPRYQTITVLGVPFSKLAEIGMTSGQLGRILASITAAGIGVDRVEFFGTFEYVGDDLGFDLDTGYADYIFLRGGELDVNFMYVGDNLEFDLETGYTDYEIVGGGTLGDLYQPANDPELPL